MKPLLTAKEVKNFLQLRNGRVRLELDTFHGAEKLVFFVAGRDFHYFNKVINELAPLGVFIEVRRLKVWECRFKKIQLPEGY